MRVAVLSRALLVAAAPLLLGACGTGANKSCTLLGCTSAAHVVANLTATEDQMRTATVVACRNTICSHGTPADVPVAPPARNEMLLRGKATTQAYIEATSAGYLVEVIFPLDDSSPAVNGDTYELHVKDANGASLGDVTGKAAYTDTAPNGKDCPPVCKNATIS